MTRDRYIKTDRSFVFFTVITLRIKAIISNGAATATVTSHQWPSSNVTKPSNMKEKKAMINNKKTVVSPTDHFPNRVFGKNEVFIVVPPFCPYHHPYINPPKSL